MLLVAATEAIVALMLIFNWQLEVIGGTKGFCTAAEAEGGEDGEDGRTGGCGGFCITTEEEASDPIGCAGGGKLGGWLPEAHETLGRCLAFGFRACPGRSCASACPEPKGCGGIRKLESCAGAHEVGVVARQRKFGRV